VKNWETTPQHRDWFEGERLGKEELGTSREPRHSRPRTSNHTEKNSSRWRGTTEVPNPLGKKIGRKEPGATSLRAASWKKKYRHQIGPSTPESVKRRSREEHRTDEKGGTSGERKKEKTPKCRHDFGKVSPGC